MRVIAGSAGGIQLLVPRRGVRPTMDRVKAAIFSSLADAIVGASVLDLFAGTGGLGIEALSRGASSVLFVDDDKRSVAAIEKNLAKTRLNGRVRQQDVFEFLRRSKSRDKFRIIFADPPYEKTPAGERFTEKLLSDKSLPQLLDVRGILILEKRTGEDLADSRFWKTTRRKPYGATEVLFLQHASAGLLVPRKTISSPGSA
jgi:16S rRNA (guanine966-N2)-methyltransferase